jgi:hypothetical protein
MNATINGNLTKCTKAGSRRMVSLGLAAIALTALIGCDANPPVPSADSAPSAAETKPTEPAVPDEIQGAAKTLLGSDVKVLVFGDLAKNGNQQFLAANILPKTPTNAIPGTIVSRAVIVEKDDGQWVEVLHVDEHLKNQKGVLGRTPLQPVTGWRLQYEQDPVQGLQLYFTPENTSDPHVMPIGVRWNPKVKRYQSTDASFEKFLPEASQMSGTPRSSLR